MMTTFRRTYAIHSWRRWDADIDAAARAFKAEFGLFPDILLASTGTLAQIDLVASKSRLVDAAGNRPGEYEHAAVGSFDGADYRLSFCLDERLPARAVSLIHDDDPDDGEPVPADDSPVIVRQVA